MEPTNMFRRKKRLSPKSPDQIGYGGALDKTGII
jgi:hypothetical protein